MSTEKNRSSNRRFSRSRRLENARDFELVFDRPEFRVAHPNFLLLATTNNREYARVGLVVAKKNVRLSVSRNRIKRVVRETFRLADDEFGCLDVVFLARRGIDKLTPAEQTELLRHSWKRLASKVAKSEQKA